MMDKSLDIRNFIGTAQGDKSHMLGKFLYFSLANLLVEKEALSKLCDDLNIPYTFSKRLSVADAFRSATGDIRERVPVTSMGQTNIYLAYCRDNKRENGVLSRELVKETLNRQTNRYEKLANISYDKADNVFRCENLMPDDAIDVRGCCRRAEELFELYQIQPQARGDHLLQLSSQPGGHQAEHHGAHVLCAQDPHGWGGRLRGFHHSPGRAEQKRCAADGQQLLYH